MRAAPAHPPSHSVHPGCILLLPESAAPTLCASHPHFLSSPSPYSAHRFQPCRLSLTSQLYSEIPHPGKCPQGRAGFLLWLRPPPKPRREKGCREAGGGASRKSRGGEGTGHPELRTIILKFMYLGRAHGRQTLC